MPLTCVRCGLQNPDGNAYCQNCGTPLGAPAGVTGGAFAGPPPGPAPWPPQTFQSPYYTPAAPTAPVHRTPWLLIVGLVVALIVVAGGLGTALALLGNRGAPSAASTLGDIPTTPTPGVSPSPVALPTSTQAQTGLEANNGFSVTVPSGWAVDTKDSETIVLSDPDGQGSVSISSGVSIPTQTAQENKDTIDHVLTSKYPDAHPCSGSKTIQTTLNGVNGLSWSLCFTVTEGANSVPAAGSLFSGANTSGTVYYLVMVITAQSNLGSYVSLVSPVVHSIHWKLS